MVRSATIEDAPRLLEIYSHYVANTAVTFEWDVPTIDEFRSRIDGVVSKYPYLVAEDEAGNILGYAYAHAFRERAAYSWCVEVSIYVDLEHRGRGTGRKLYEALEKALASQNIQCMVACVASCAEEDEHLSKGSPLFHERLGFREVGCIEKAGYKFGRWYDIMYMQKDLAPRPEKPELVVPYSA